MKLTPGADDARKNWMLGINRAPRFNERITEILRKHTFVLDQDAPRDLNRVEELLGEYIRCADFRDVEIARYNQYKAIAMPQAASAYERAKERLALSHKEPKADENNKPKRNPDELARNLQKAFRASHISIALQEYSSTLQFLVHCRRELRRLKKNIKEYKEKMRALEQEIVLEAQGAASASADSTPNNDNPTKKD